MLTHPSFYSMQIVITQVLQSYLKGKTPNTFNIEGLLVAGAGLEPTTFGL